MAIGGPSSSKFTIYYFAKPLLGFGGGVLYKNVKFSWGLWGFFGPFGGQSQKIDSQAGASPPNTQTRSHPVDSTNGPCSMH